jgi:hypothetical protein
MAFYSLNTSDVPTKFFLDDELEALKSIKLDELPDLSTEEAILQQNESKLLSKKEPPPKPPKKNNNVAGNGEAIEGENNVDESPTVGSGGKTKDDRTNMDVKEDEEEKTKAGVENGQENGNTDNMVEKATAEGADSSSDPNTAHAVDNADGEATDDKKTDGDGAKEDVTVDDKTRTEKNNDTVAPTILPTNVGAEANVNTNTIDTSPVTDDRSMSGKYALAVVEQTEKDELMARLIDRDAKADVMSQRVQISKEEAVFYLESTDDLNLEAAIAIYESFKN